MKTLTISILILTASCATMFNGKTETVRIESIPPGQPITVDGTTHTTPALIEMGNREEHLVTFADGKTMTISRRFSPWFFANVVWFPGIMVAGMLVDIGSGGSHSNLEPDHVIHKEGEIWNGETGKVLTGADVEPPEKRKAVDR